MMRFSVLQPWRLLGAISLVAAQSNISDESSLLWGAYRPNLYFGLRPQIPQSLMTGLVWFGTHDYQAFSRARHSCDQGDGLDSYTWTQYDAKLGGSQRIVDGQVNFELTTEYVKVPGGSTGGSWAARIRGVPMNSATSSRISLVFYAGLEGLGGLEMETEEDENGIDGPVTLTGSSPELEDFTVRVVDGPENSILRDGSQSAVFAKRIGKTHVAGFRAPPGQIWQAKEMILQNIITQARAVIEPYQSTPASVPDPSFALQLNDEILSGSNLFAIQKTFDGAFSFDVYFESASAGHKLNASTLDHSLQRLTAAYNERFENMYRLPDEFNGRSDYDALKRFSKDITANLLGGIGYFYGTSIVDKGFAYEWDQEDEPVDSVDNDKEGASKESGAKMTEPRSLLTATPSRSFFPRGFYWDEGFHLLHIGGWDNDLSLTMLKSWIDLIDENGWVGREQILGEEARSKVPAEFQTQVPTNANPPTLAMAVTAFIHRLQQDSRAAGELSDDDLGMGYAVDAAQKPMSARSNFANLESREEALKYLRSIYAPLKRHYEWFRRTQRGQIKQYSRQARSRTEGYRWRGRSAQHVLTSGMDDYPRGPPSAGELHLDLISWMAFFSRTMREIAEYIGETEDATSFFEIEKAIIDNIDDLHWNEEEQMYCDVGVNDDDESYHVCHRGYLSLFPLMLGVLPPNSKNLGPIIDMLHDPKQLWSAYGIRSLSASHPDFGQGENYWKGPIWIQMNYLVLKALHETYAVHEGPFQGKAQELYRELRQNVIENVFKEYQRTGYVWEQYDALNGEGRRSHPFTGWTSLLTLIISEVY